MVFNSQTGYYTCITNKKQSEHFCVLYTLNSFCLIYHLSNIEFLVLWYLTYQAQCLCTSFRSFKECTSVLLCSRVGAVAKTQLNTICFNQKKNLEKVIKIRSQSLGLVLHRSVDRGWQKTGWSVMVESRIQD